MCEKYNNPSHRSIFRAIARLWPASCAICHQPGEHGVDLCTACRRHLPGLVLTVPDGDPAARVVETLCRRCGERFDGPLSDESCAVCAARPSPFTRLVVPWRYDFPLDNLIRHMKYREQRVLARVFGTLLAREACTGSADEGREGMSAAQRRGGGHPLPDGILAVPSRAARRERGFDHAAALAHWCARELDLPDRSALAERIGDTGALAGLSRAARHDRVRGAFRVDGSVHGQRVAIVDDVLTSGATATEFARELYDTGAVSVELWVLARTPAAR